MASLSCHNCIKLNTFLDESELTVGYYDGFIWYHEDDLKEAYNFLQSVRDIELKNKKKVKIAMYDGEEFVSLGGSEFQRLDKTFERCTFCFIFLSKTFIKDKWSKIIADSLLMKTIYSDEKQWCVLPVITAPRAKLDFEIPLGLNALREVKFFTENRQFIPCLQALFNDRVHEREMKERKNQNKLAFQQERRLSKSIAACNIKDGERKPISTSTILQEPNAHNDLEVDGVQDKADLPIANDIQIVQPVKTNAKGGLIIVIVIILLPCQNMNTSIEERLDLSCVSHIRNFLHREQFSHVRYT